jgi:hypothetical protein
MTHKPSGPTGWMEKGPTGTRQMEKGLREDFYDELQASWMSNYRSHKYTSDGEGSHKYTSDGERTERRLYDELQASRMSNCWSHMYTSDGERTMCRLMMKCHLLQIENYSS